MLYFILTKGGKPENAKKYLVKLTHNVDEGLLKSAINSKASENCSDGEILSYLDSQFRGVEDVIEFDTLKTFYY